MRRRARARRSPPPLLHARRNTAHFFTRTLQSFAAARAASGDARPVWFLDVGANIGVHSTAVSAAGFPVLAVEGFPSSAARLACSKLLNKWEGLVVVNEAVAPTTSRVCFAVRSEENQGMNWLDGSSANIGKCPFSAVVQARGLSDIIEHHQPHTLVPPAIVKVDIEGSELIMLKTFVRHLEGRHAGAASAMPWPGAPTAADRLKWRPEVFVFELRSELLVAHAATIQDVVEFLAGYGYRFYNADGAGPELTKIADRAAYDQAAADAVLVEHFCPNYMALRADLDIKDFSNPTACGERR